MVRLRSDVKVHKCSLAQSEQIDSFICKQCLLCSLGGRDSTAGIPATLCSRGDSDIYIDVLFMPQLPQAERVREHSGQLELVRPPFHCRPQTMLGRPFLSFSKQCIYLVGIHTIILVLPKPTVERRSNKSNVISGEAALKFVRRANLWFNGLSRSISLSMRSTYFPPFPWVSWYRTDNSLYLKRTH